MSQNPRRRIIVVSAISGVLVFGAAGFAAAATGSNPTKRVDIVVPAVVDPSISVDPAAVIQAPALVGDDNGTESSEESTEPTVSIDPTASSIDDNGDDDSTEVENESDDDSNQTGNNQIGSNQSGDDHGGDHGGNGGDDGGSDD